MTIVTDTRTAPAAWAVAEARRKDAFDVSQGSWSSGMHEPVTPKTEDEIMAEAARLEAYRTAYLLSPHGRITAACDMMEAAGQLALSQSVRSAADRGVDFHTHAISANACGSIIRILDGINTEASRVVLRAVADNLHSL